MNLEDIQDLEEKIKYIPNIINFEIDEISKKEINLKIEISEPIKKIETKIEIIKNGSTKSRELF